MKNLNGCVARGPPKGLLYLAMPDLSGDRVLDGSLQRATLGSLVMPQVLIPGGCSLDGPLPPQIALATQVQELRPRDNELSGPALPRTADIRPLTEQASHTNALLSPSLF